MSSFSTSADTTSRSASALLPGRADFPHFLAISTRWTDNEVYSHVNNVVYFSYFDASINEWLMV